MYISLRGSGTKRLWSKTKGGAPSYLTAEPLFSNGLVLSEVSLLLLSLTFPGIGYNPVSLWTMINNPQKIWEVCSPLVTTNMDIHTCIPVGKNHFLQVFMLKMAFNSHCPLFLFVSNENFLTS